MTHEDLRQVGLPEMLSKLWDNLPGILQNDLPRLGGSWLGAFFLVGLLVPNLLAGFSNFTRDVVTRQAKSVLKIDIQ